MGHCLSGNKRRASQNLFHRGIGPADAADGEMKRGGGGARAGEERD